MESIAEFDYHHRIDIIKKNIDTKIDNKLILFDINNLIIDIKLISKMHTGLVYLYYLKGHITKDNVYFIAARDIYMHHYKKKDNILTRELDWMHLTFSIDRFYSMLHYTDLHFIPTFEKDTYTIDKQHRYIVKQGEHVKYQYEIMGSLGRGAFSNVYKCTDHKTQSIKALKIIRNELAYNKQVSTEIEILKQLEGSPYIYTLLDSFTFRKHFFLVFNIYKNNLYQELKQRNFNPFSYTQVKQVTYQLLIVLETLLKYKIIHADLKPENIVIDYIDASSIKIKVIDFGSSTYQHDKIHTYIQSRYYRAPEIMLGCKYDMGIDLWSLGCIMYELFIGKALFSSKNEKILIQNHYNFLGEFDNCFIKSITNKTIIKDLYCWTEPYKKLDTLVLHQSFYNLLKKIFKWDSNKRISIKDALNDRYIIEKFPTAQFY